MVTVLWAYLRNNAFRRTVSVPRAADLTGRANHLAVTIETDIVKQKQATCNGGYRRSVSERPIPGCTTT